MCLTDIHAHVLPGLDDGPRNESESDKLLSTMRRDGVSNLFCTSHYCNPYFHVSLRDMTCAFNRLKCSERATAYPDLAFGGEIYLSCTLKEDLLQETIPCLGTTPYVLVEFDTISITRAALELIYELRLRKFIPILAHPERNLVISRHPSWIDELREQGLLMQATAGCFADESIKRKSRANKLAWWLLEQGKIDVIATDAHNLTSRPPGLRVAYERISEKLGDKIAMTLIDNANAIWVGEDCTPIELSTRRQCFTPWARWFC